MYGFPSVANRFSFTAMDPRTSEWPRSIQKKNALSRLKENRWDLGFDLSIYLYNNGWSDFPNSLIHAYDTVTVFALLPYLVLVPALAAPS